MQPIRHPSRPAACLRPRRRPSTAAARSRWPSSGRAPRRGRARLRPLRAADRGQLAGVSVPSPTRARRRARATRASGSSRAVRVLALPSFTAVAEATVAGEVQFGVLPIESTLVGPGRRDARPAPRRAALDRRRDVTARSATACSASSEVPLERDPRRPLAPGRARPVPPAARGDAVGDRDRRGTTAEAARRGRRARRPDARRRSRASGRPRSTG